MNKLTNHPKSMTWCLVLSLSVLAVGCGGGGGQDPILGANVAVFTPPSGSIIPGATCSIAGATIPRVTISTPTNGNQTVSTSTAGTANNGKLITATFSLEMNPATINASSFLVAPTGSAALVPASVTYTAGSRIATFRTASALLANTEYTAAVLNTVTSAAGTPMGCSYSWNFRTAAAPVTESTSSDFLGRVAPFAIAAAAGIANNTGTTTINGDTVLSPTATCKGDPVPGGTGTLGFGDCGGTAPITAGKVVTPTNPDTTTASAIMADLRAAYNSLTKANLPNATVLGCGTIGSAGDAGAGIGCAGNATLAPGVYISSSDSSIGVTGVLTLDGQGDSEARFVFQAPSSTLTTATGNPGAPGSTIRLINGAKASNVFWQVGSSATIGTYSEFRGNVLADTSVTMQTDATSCGRMLAGAVTTSGAFTFAGNTVSVPGHASAPGCE